MARPAWSLRSCRFYSIGGVEGDERVDNGEEEMREDGLAEWKTKVLPIL